MQMLLKDNLSYPLLIPLIGAILDVALAISITILRLLFLEFYLIKSQKSKIEGFIRFNYIISFILKV
jgi:hypothetical protein